MPLAGGLHHFPVGRLRAQVIGSACVWSGAREQQGQGRVHPVGQGGTAGCTAARGAQLGALRPAQLGRSRISDPPRLGAGSA